MQINPIPVEETDPEFAGLLKWYCEGVANKTLPTIDQHRAMIKSLKLGRNDPCFCGSGIKFKKCCGKDL